MTTTFKTQLQYAQEGVITDAMRAVAAVEYCQAECIRQGVAEGTIIIPINKHHAKLNPIGIGRTLTCKINANIGASPVISDRSFELDKLHVAVAAGADAVMDLSTGKHITEIRQAIIDGSTLPLGTVPIYEAFDRAGNINDLTVDMMFEVIEEQAAQGVDFMTIHCGVLREYVEMAKKRLIGIVSRGGSLMAQWMVRHDKENPFYTEYDRLLAICQQHDVALSLGDGFRPGALADASDEAQFGELKTLGELVARSHPAGVQVMVEGPGHLPFDQIQMNMARQIEWCHGAPFYVLGPLVTDIAPGYDHITSAIGGTMAAFCGASMLCYVTPREHLGLPSVDDVRQGVIACKIAAHAADIATGKPHARERDDALSRARFSFDWEKQFELALDPTTARVMHEEVSPKQGEDSDDKYCSMCGQDFCPMRVSQEINEK